MRTILADAARRDAVADVRDARADVREKEASLNAFVRPAYGDHVASLQARRASATNRVESKSDRSSSADDRTKLTEALSVRAGDDAWVMLLSNHARVLATIAANPSSTLRHLALTVDITERSVFSIIDDLDEGGYLVRHKHGRRNSYELDLGRHVMAGHDGTVGDLIRLFST